MLKKLLLLLFVFCYDAHSQKIELPVEVFGLPVGADIRDHVELEGLGLLTAVADVYFTLDQEMLDRIATENGLYLQINNCSYNEKVTVRVNSVVPRITLEQGRDDFTGRNTTLKNVDIFPAEEARGGMAHGGFNTIRLKVNGFGKDDFIVGKNNIRFFLNKSDGISNGFRVIDLDLLDSAGNRILKENPYYLPEDQTQESDRISGESYYVHDDPETWTDPYTEDGLTVSLADSIAKGKSLWYYGRGGDFESEQMGEDLWSNYLPSDRSGFWYGYDLGSGTPIKAKCTNCHTQDGRDMEIFAYSNLSIIERSKFHRLTDSEGKLIAAYIRSLSASDGDKGNIHRYGRPWNPPYQPGPQLAGKPIDEWAAGAGLDAVLENDADMLPYLMPDRSQEGINNFFDSDDLIDQTELPLAIQFPDWKHWLPIVHPMDAFGDYWNTSPGNAPTVGYQAFRNFLIQDRNGSGVYTTTNGVNIAQREAFLGMHKDFHTGYRLFFRENALKSNHWRSIGGDANKSLLETVPRELAATSMARLFSVQNFEIFNEFNLQDKAQGWLDRRDNTSDFEKKNGTKLPNRQWMAGNDAYNAFEVPAHFQASIPSSTSRTPFDENAWVQPGKYSTLNIPGNSTRFYNQEESTGEFETTNWYHLQIILNGGHGFLSHNTPVDYNYTPMFILRASSSSAIPEPMRYYSTLNTMYQTRTWSGTTVPDLTVEEAVSPNSGDGFRIRVMGPWFFYGMTFRNQFEGFQPGEFSATLNGLESGLQTKVINAQLTQFLKEIEDQGTDREDLGVDNFLYNDGKNRLYNTDGTLYWERYLDGGNDDSNNLDRKDKNQWAEPKDGVFDEANFLSDRDFAGRYADKMYYLMPKFKALGVDSNLIYGMLNWSKAAWPLLDWDSLGITPFDDGEEVVILAKGVDDYFSIEQGTTANLSATNTPTTNEEFTIGVSGSSLTIKGSNNLYLSSENGTAPVQVNESVVTATEEFTFEYLGGNEYAIRGSNNKYLSYANVADLRVDAQTISNTERFVILNSDAILSVTNPLDNKASMVVSISSNPVSDVLKIVNMQEDYRATIYNMMGQEVKGNVVINSENNTINVSSLPTGSYVLVLKGGTSNQVLKFIKL